MTPARAGATARTGGTPPGRPPRPSAAVYRRRRLVALVLLVALLVAVIWAVTALLGGGEEEPAAVEPTRVTAVSTAQGEPRECAPADLDVDLSLDPPSPAVGEEVAFGLVVTNDGNVPCLMDAGPAALSLTVRSGADEVWSSAHCAGDATEPILLDAGASREHALAWSGGRSAAGCPGNQPAATGGTYRVVADYAGNRVGPTDGLTFTLG
ncbi:hypothetical protein [Georgenia faecalis]|uniref:DUF4232 domain-containing protein n=1 Tax=Georgenia faecalis TaxID=2483799 RepID=A0ABV9D7H3_9MICO|nr:hypothetical protein [Georgenia faecalis]